MISTIQSVKVAMHYLGEHTIAYNDKYFLDYIERQKNIKLQKLKEAKIMIRIHKKVLSHYRSKYGKNLQQNAQLCSTLGGIKSIQTRANEYYKN